MEENIHAGHRARLLETIHNCGIDKVPELQAVEYILCLIIPRIDVNPLAHRLLDKYKSVSAILDAPAEDLAEVHGLGKVGAMKLASIKGILNLYSHSKLKNSSKKLNTMGEVYDFLQRDMRFRQKEEVRIFGINPQSQICCERTLSQGDRGETGVKLKDISFFIATYGVEKVILVHNHPEGKAVPSSKDIESHNLLTEIFKFAGCQLVDNLIVGMDGIYSLGKSRLVRQFEDFKNQ